MFAQTIQDEDYVISDCGHLGSKLSVDISQGKHLGIYDTWKDAEEAISADMDKEQFYPHVYYVNDHGNIEQHNWR